MYYIFNILYSNVMRYATLIFWIIYQVNWFVIVSTSVTSLNSWLSTWKFIDVGGFSDYLSVSDFRWCRWNWQRIESFPLDTKREKSIFFFHIRYMCSSNSTLACELTFKKELWRILMNFIFGIYIAMIF